MPYYKKTINGKVIQKKCALVKPDGNEWELIDGDSALVEVYIEPVLTYNAKRFLASCALDTINPELADAICMQLITSKLSDRQYFDFGLCLQNANFEMLAVIVTQLVTASVLTTEDVTYFSSKLLTEEGVEL